MIRFLILIYGVASYVIGLGGLVFFLLFLGGWEFLPRHVDSTPPGSLVLALLVNTGLIALFGLHHSVTARPGFKRVLTKMMPSAAERSTYVLLSGLILLLIGCCWQPLPGTVWHVENQTLRMCLTVVQLLGWGLVVATSFVINHFELFGLQQVYFHFTDTSEPPPVFTDRLLYKIVRHPLQLGVLIGIWCTATMSMTHLMLSATMTVYIFIGLYFEERDLVASLGQDYADYRKRVPMLLPMPWRRGRE